MFFFLRKGLEAPSGAQFSLSLPRPGRGSPALVSARPGLGSRERDGESKGQRGGGERFLMSRACVSFGLRMSSARFAFFFAIGLFVLVSLGSGRGLQRVSENRERDREGEKERKRSFSGEATADNTVQLGYVKDELNRLC